jgi:hypothetical protein
MTEEVLNETALYVCIERDWPGGYCTSTLYYRLPVLVFNSGYVVAYCTMYTHYKLPVALSLVYHAGQSGERLT